MSIYKKLLQLQKSVKALGKDAKGQSYEYVSGSKLLFYVRPKMDELGLLLKQEIISVENHREDYQTRNGAKSEMFCSVDMRFTWVDVETGETDVNLFHANGMNGWDKGLGSALTYAERYFILKYFHIATDEDDVDALIRDDAEAAEKPKTKSRAKSKKTEEAVDNILLDALNEVDAATNYEELVAVWNRYPSYQDNKEFKNKVAYSPVNKR